MFCQKLMVLLATAYMSFEWKRHKSIAKITAPVLVYELCLVMLWTAL